MPPFKEITSPANPLFKQLKRLSTTDKERRQLGKAIIEGTHLAQSFLAANWRPEMLIVDPHWQSNPEIKNIVEQCQTLNIEGLVLPRNLFNQISGVENSTGLLLVINTPNPSPVTYHSPLQHSSLLLDRIQDPGNLGTILRTAAAAGIKHIYCSTGCASIYSPKVLRAAMGAHTALQIFENADLSVLISNSQIPVYATSLQATQTLYDLDLAQSTAWLMGSEGQGVSPQLLQLKNIHPIIIPQEPNVESLNVATATALCLFEQRRQKLSTGYKA